MYIIQHNAAVSGDSFRDLIHSVKDQHVTNDSL